MIRNHRSALLLAGLLALALLSGCADNPAAPGDTQQTDFTEPAALLAGQAAAIAAMDAERYAALLEAPDAQGDGGFRYYPSAAALPSVPWLAGDSWGYDDERGMMGNLLSGRVSRALRTHVQRMEFALQVFQEWPGSAGTTVLGATLQARVTMAQGPVVALQQPISMELARDAHGYLRIRSLHELSLGRAASVTPRSWTELLAAFRDPGTPQEVVAAHAFVLEQRDLDGYAALLHPDFEYVPQDSDFDDFPWIPPGGHWDRANELDMIANMMNPAFVSEVTGESVDSIQMQLTVTGEVPFADSVQVACNTAIQVLWTASSGAYSRVRFLFTIVPGEHGRPSILRIAELPEFHRQEASVDESSWGSIKNLYRSVGSEGRPGMPTVSGVPSTVARSEGEAVEPATWGRIKADFR